eukprot:611426-Amphidinium_carterae.1
MPPNLWSLSCLAGTRLRSQHSFSGKEAEAWLRRDPMVKAAGLLQLVRGLGMGSEQSVDKS